MSLQIPGMKNVFNRRKTILRTDIIKFGTDIQLLSAAGTPSGNWPEASLFLNSADQKLYASTSFKQGNTPDAAWYKFNGNAVDFSGNKNTGVVAGTAGYTPVKYNQGLTLEGTDTKVTIPNALGLAWDADWTVSFWCTIPNLTVNGQEVTILEQYRDADDYISIKIRKISGSIRIIVAWARGTGDTVENVGFALTAGELTWLGLHYDLSDNSLRGLKFVNSTLTDEDTIVTLPTIAFTTEDYTVGFTATDSSFGDVSFDLDDLKIWTSTRDYTRVSLDVWPAVGRIDILNLDAINWINWLGEVDLSTL